MPNRDGVASAAPEVATRRRPPESGEVERDREQMLAVVAHDLRTPLSAISISAHVLRARFGETKELGTIVRACGRAMQLIDDLLLASKLGNRALPFRLAPTDLHFLLEHVAEEHAPIACVAQVNIEVEAPPGLRILADPERLLQMLSNLIVNALKFTKRGGRVRLVAETRGERVALIVADDGEGIPPSQLPQVFERYWRGSSSPASGAGLGLFIAKEIAEAHEGSITVESQLGVGTKFTVLLPQLTI